MSVDVIVIGGGVIGLSCAWRLAQQGARVTLIEAATTGSGATAAAAGMLAPLAEVERQGAFVRLAVESLRQYPAFLAEIENASGETIALQGEGILHVALTEDEERRMQENFSWQLELGFRLELLTSRELRKLEPSISPAVIGARFSPEERHIDPRALAAALTRAAEAAGVEIISNSRVTAFRHGGSRVDAVDLPGRRLSARDILISGGAWSGAIGDLLGASIPVFPVRGQIALLSRVDPPVHHTIYSRSGYLVPRNGTVLVGATEEHAGFDAFPTLEGISSLLSFAPRLVPSLLTAQFETAWAGLRPATPDRLPLLGRFSRFENVHLATGHFRNGILLAPVTAELIARSILEQHELSKLAPFRPDRFEESGGEAGPVRSAVESVSPQSHV